MVTRGGKNLNTERGSMLVEFALSFFVIMLFLFGILSLGMWGLGSIYVKSAANEAALIYARTLEYDDAVAQAEKVLRGGGNIFLSGNLDVSTEIATPVVQVTVTGYPKITRLFTFAKPTITHVSKCVMEGRYRNPSAYER